MSTEIVWRSRQEVADQGQVGIRTVDRWAKAGKLTKHQDARGAVRFKAEEVDALLRPEPATGEIDPFAD